MDLFHWIGTFSASMRVNGPRVTTETVTETYAPVFADPDATNAQLKLLWIGVGTEETGMLRQHKVLRDVLNEHRIRHTYVEERGGHTWHVWRRNLRDLLPLLLR